MHNVSSVCHITYWNIDNFVKEEETKGFGNKTGTFVTPKIVFHGHTVRKRLLNK